MKELETMNRYELKKFGSVCFKSMTGIECPVNRVVILNRTENSLLFRVGALNLFINLDRSGDLTTSYANGELFRNDALTKGGVICRR